MKVFPTTLLILSCTACSGGGGSSDATPSAQVVFEITDAPLDPALVTSAVVEITSISMHVEGDADSGFITVCDEPFTFDLTQLRNGITRSVDSGDLPPGSYSQVRLILGRGVLELRNGRRFRTEDGSLELTSQDKSGFKVFLDPPIVLEEGGQGRVLLDFDLSKTFKPIPANDPPNASKFHLHPNIRAAVGPLSLLTGVVLLENPEGLAEPVGGAKIYVLPVGELDVENRVALTLTEEDGSMAILGLDEGTYDIVVEYEEESLRTDGVEITADWTTFVDVTLGS